MTVNDSDNDFQELMILDVGDWVSSMHYCQNKQKKMEMVRDGLS